MPRVQITILQRRFGLWLLEPFLLEPFLLEPFLLEPFLLEPFLLECFLECFLDFRSRADSFLANLPSFTTGLLGAGFMISSSSISMVSSKKD